jgi:HemY protein
MRVLFWVLAIFALAAGLVVAARYNTGYALLVFPPYRVELSLNLLLIVVLGSAVLAYLLIRVVTATVALPARVRRYRDERRRSRELSALLEALREWLAGRYARAEKAAASITLEEYAGLAAVIAAKCAHALRAFDRRDDYLSRARTLGEQDETARMITEAEFLLDQQHPREALETLQALGPRKHTAALRLEMQAQQVLRNWDAVVPLIDQLERRGVFDEAHAERLRRRARAESFRRKDARMLAELWKKLPEDQRMDAQVAAAAARAYIAGGDSANAQRIIEASLDVNWDSQLVALYGWCDGDTVRQIERAEAWLQRQPRDATLLLTLAQLCARQGLWGKAQSYVEASIAVDPTYAAHLEAAQLYERAGNVDAANRHYRESLALAVARIRDTEEARRRLYSLRASTQATPAN